MDALLTYHDRHIVVGGKDGKLGCLSAMAADIAQKKAMLRRKIHHF